jgi:uncharacterized membrane protein
MHIQRHARALAILAAFPAAVYAQATFEIIGAPAPGVRTFATHISGDGRVVVGVAMVWQGSSGNQLFRWTGEQGFVLGGSSYPHDWHWPAAVSTDGSVVAGTTDPLWSHRRSFRWSTIFERPSMPIDGEHFATGMSGDGAIIVGYVSSAVPSPSWFEAYLWQDSSITLPFASPQTTTPFSMFLAIAGDGTLFGLRHGQPFRLDASGFQPLPFLPLTVAASVDSSVIVGKTNPTPQSAATPARWIAGGFDGPHFLDPLRRGGNATGISADGMRIVGAISDGAFLWDPIIGFSALADYLRQHGASVPSGWSLSSASISRDGATLAGTGYESPGAPAQAWRATIPLFCYANCDGSNLAPALNILDFVCFLQKFAAADPYANCDQSTTPPVLNIDDFSCFLQKFAAGCP